MADEYDYDVDEFDYEDGWMYVEDEYGLAVGTLRGLGRLHEVQTIGSNT